MCSCTHHAYFNACRCSANQSSGDWTRANRANSATGAFVKQLISHRKLQDRKGKGKGKGKEPKGKAKGKGKKAFPQLQKSQKSNRNPRSPRSASHQSFPRRFYGVYAVSFVSFASFVLIRSLRPLRFVMLFMTPAWAAGYMRVSESDSGA